MSALFSASIQFLSAMGLLDPLQYFIGGVFFIILVGVFIKVLSK